MGTRYEDQPPEHWAGPESLDPTPTWKQFLVVGLLGLAALAIIAVVAALALAPMFVTPPALVPGGRLVLSLSDLTAAPGGALRVEPPLLPTDEAVWIVRYCEGTVNCERPEYLGLAATWVHPVSGARCPVASYQTTEPSFGGSSVRWIAGGDCMSANSTFGARGEPITAPRGLDRYLVSVEGDRVIVNISRPIRGFGATPQPLVSPLATPVQTSRP